MVKHNNMVPNNKLHKDWQRYIKTHFDQPMKRKRRALIRRRKLATKAPRPLNKLRPMVNCPTQKYNMRIRSGRGFSLAELKEANLHPRYARTIGIAVDPRRRNRSQEGLSRNVRRLKRYMARLVLFPKPPKREDRRNKEKMLQYLEATERAKNRISQYQRFSKTPMNLKRSKKQMAIVNIDDVPQYNAYATLKNEWVLQHKHFAWRRKNIKLAKKRLIEKKKKEKKRKN